MMAGPELAPRVIWPRPVALRPDMVLLLFFLETRLVGWLAIQRSYPTQALVTAG